MEVVFSLLQIGWQLEGRSYRGLAPGALFVIAASFVIYLSLQAAQGAAQVSATMWNLLFWLLFLFMSLYVGGHVAAMRRGRVLFYFLLADAGLLWGVWVLRMFAVFLCLGTLALGMQVLWLGNPILLGFRFAGVLVLASAGFSVLLTSLSLMVARLEASGLLFVVLSLPLLVPLSVFCVRATASCLAVPTLRAATGADLWPLVGFVLLLTSLGWLIFPYIWKA